MRSTPWGPTPRRRAYRAAVAVAGAVLLSGGMVCAPDAHVAGASTVDLVRSPSPAGWPMLVNASGVVVGVENPMLPPAITFVWDGTTVATFPGGPGALSEGGAVAFVTNSTPTVDSQLALRAPNGDVRLAPPFAPGWATTPAGFVGETVLGTASAPSTAPEGAPLDDRRAVTWNGQDPLAELPGLAGRGAHVLGTDGAHIAVGASTGTDGLVHLVRWVDLGQLEDLGPVVRIGAPLQWSKLNVVRIHRNGRIGGWFWAGAARVAFGWSSGAASVSTAPFPTGFAPREMNDAGQWFGMACDAASSSTCIPASWMPGHPVQPLWRAGQPAIPGELYDMNEHGRAVGFVGDGPASYRGFLWEPDCGEITWLDGSTPTFPTVITADGLILGSSFAGADTRAFTATVHFEPCAPEGLAGSVSSAGVRVQWQAAAGRDAPVDRYEVWRDGASIGQVDGAMTTFVDSAAGPGDHSYTVTAANVYGDSAPSAPVRLTVAASGSTSALPAPSASAVTASPPYTG